MSRSRPSLLLSCLLLWLAPSLFAAESSGDASRRIVLVTLEVAGEAPSQVEIDVELVAAPFDDGPAEDRTVRLADGRGSAELALTSDRLWRLLAEAPGFWHAPRVVELDDEVVRLRLWPTAIVEGTLVGDRAAQAEGTIPVRLEPAEPSGAQSRRQPDGSPEIDCPVDDEARLRCDVPRGFWHLRLAPPGYAPFYVWRVPLHAGKPSDLGRLEMVRGGSVFGRIEARDGAMSGPGITVAASPRVDAGGLSPVAAGALANSVRVTSPTQEGRFQLVGLPEGEVIVQARREEDAAASDPTIVAVTTDEGFDLVHPLELRPPVRLALEIAPPADPFGRPWDVVLHQEESASTLRIEDRGETAEDGTWRSHPLREGRYAVQVLDEEGQSYAWEEVELSNGTPPVEIDLPVVYVDGVVRLGEEPLQSRVWFGGRTGSEKIEVESDEEGRFFVVLPRPGEWTVDVSAPRPPVTSRSLSVEVVPLAHVGAAEVVVEVPNTRIEGEVLEASGLPPATPPRVTAVPRGPRGRPLVLDGAPDGSFQFRGLAPGTYSVEAETEEAGSQPYVVDVREGEDLDIRLVLRRKRTAAGRVTSASGPVAYASVIGYPLAGYEAPSSAWLTEERSGTDGRFRLRVPAGTDRLRLLTRAPGYALDLRLVEKGSTLEVQLRRRAGTVRLVPPADAEGSVGLVMIDGQPIELPRLVEWARMQGAAGEAEAGVVVPGLPPGHYALCELRPEEALPVLLGAALPAAGACNEGSLTAGGELVLEAPG